jgi:hypothetical protein
VTVASGAQLRVVGEGAAFPDRVCEERVDSLACERAGGIEKRADDYRRARVLNRAVEDDRVVAGEVGQPAPRQAIPVAI